MTDPGRLARTDLLPGAPSSEAMRNGRDEYVGWRPVESGNGRSLVEWTPPPHLANPLGQVHGGFLGVVVDDVCGMAFASLLTEFRPFPTLSMQLEYHRPIRVGEPHECRGTVVRVGRRTVVVDTVVVGRDGRLCARGTATFSTDLEGATLADGRPLPGFSALDPGP